MMTSFVIFSFLIKGSYYVRKIKQHFKVSNIGLE